eukprot:82400-Chlamydomonas_euryale.AAC.2
MGNIMLRCLQYPVRKKITCSSPVHSRSSVNPVIIHEACTDKVVYPEILTFHGKLITCIIDN